MVPVLPTQLETGGVTARVDDARLLTIKFNDVASLQAWDAIRDGTYEASKDEPFTKTTIGGDDDEGPNARGTYSKAYTAKHPEITWVHRGQGRYLPAKEARGIASGSWSE